MAETMIIEPPAPIELPAEALESALISWASTVAASEFRWLQLVAEYDRRRLYERWECRTCARWLMWHCGLDLRAAHEKVRVARALPALPIVAAAFERGELSYSKVRAITRVAHPGIEQALVDTARGIHTAGLERIVAGIRRARVLNDPERPEHQPAQRRSVTYRHEDDGTVLLVARLPAEEHAIVARAIELAAEVTTDRPYEQRRADALVDLAARALAHAADSTGRPSSTADRYQVVVRVDATVLAHRDEAGECHLGNGGAIEADTARRLCCDGTIVRLYEGAEHSGGGTVAIGARTRTIPPALRRALLARDRTCRFPGCANSAWLDAHHVRHWVDGGPTKADNLLLLCRQHHRAVHEERWSVQRAADGGWAFTDPHGWQLDPPDTVHRPLDADITVSVRPDAVRPRWYGRTDIPYIVSVLADPPDEHWTAEHWN